MKEKKYEQYRKKAFIAELLSLIILDIFVITITVLCYHYVETGIVLAIVSFLPLVTVSINFIVLIELLSLCNFKRAGKKIEDTEIEGTLGMRIIEILTTRKRKKEKVLNSIIYGKYI